MGWGHARRLVRAHPAGVVVLTLGLVLRVVVTVTYRPALEFHGDSYNYLDVAARLRLPQWHPVGYSLLLRGLTWTGSLLTVTVLQHLMGLLTAALVYRFLRTRGAHDVVAALAAAPLCLDAWQVSVEHGIVAEPLFTLLLTVAIVLLLRRDLAGRWRPAAAAGLLLAAATLTKPIAAVVAVLLVGYVAASRRGWRVVTGTTVAFALPVIGYAAAVYADYGVVGVEAYSGRYLYGETATFAECPGLPADVRPLCPRVAPDRRAGATSYAWGSDSPLNLVRADSIVTVNQRGGDFGRAVIRRQPLDFARFVAVNTLHYFAPSRVVGPRDYFAQTWQFPATTAPPPVWHMKVATVGFDGQPVTPGMTRPLAHALRGYQRVGFTPGPALAVAAVVALAAGLLRRRDVAAREAAFLSATALVLLVVTSATSGAPFDYRYLLITLSLLPPAAALGVRALAARWIESPVRDFRHVALGAGAAAVVLLATNLVEPAVTSVARQHAAHVVPLGREVALTGGLRVRVSDAALWRVRCQAPPHEEEGRVDWAVRVRVAVTDTGAERRLVHAGALYTGPTSATLGRSLTGRRSWLQDALVGGGLPPVTGWVTVPLLRRAGEISYTDATGAGTATWRLVPDVPGATPEPGASCSP